MSLCRIRLQFMCIYTYIFIFYFIMLRAFELFSIRSHIHVLNVHGIEINLKDSPTKCHRIIKTEIDGEHE